MVKSSTNCKGKVDVAVVVGVSAGNDRRKKIERDISVRSTRKGKVGSGDDGWERKDDRNNNTFYYLCPFLLVLFFFSVYLFKFASYSKW